MSNTGNEWDDRECELNVIFIKTSCLANWCRKLVVYLSLWNLLQEKMTPEHFPTSSRLPKEILTNLVTNASTGTRLSLDSKLWSLCCRVSQLSTHAQFKWQLVMVKGNQIKVQEGGGGAKEGRGDTPLEVFTGFSWQFLLGQFSGKESLSHLVISSGWKAIESPLPTKIPCHIVSVLSSCLLCFFKLSVFENMAIYTENEIWKATQI